MFENVQRAFYFNQGYRGLDKMASIAKKRLLRKKIRQYFLSALQKNKSTQSRGSVFAERSEKAIRNNFELEIITFVDCYLDDHGKSDSNLVSFQKKSSQQTVYFFTVRVFLKNTHCQLKMRFGSKKTRLVRLQIKSFTT